MTAWPLLWVVLAATVMMLGGWAWQRRSDNAGVVDVLWAAGMAASAVSYTHLDVYKRQGWVMTGTTPPTINWKTDSSKRGGATWCGGSSSK